MSVHVILRGGFGNNLFQYAIGRIIAERHGLELVCSQIRAVPAHPSRDLAIETGDATLTSMARHFPHAPLSVAGVHVDSPTQLFEIGNNRWQGQRLPFARILRDTRARRICLDGYFQRFEYLRQHERAIRHWFTVGDTPSTLAPGVKDVIVSIRRGLDFGMLGWVLPVTFYRRALAALPHIGQVYICGTGIDDTVRNAFAKYDPIYIHRGPLEEFLFIQRFARIVLANSTFAWWAAYLSQAAEIVGPRSIHNNGYAFTGFRDVDLHMRSARYRECAVDRFDRIICQVRSHLRGATLHRHHSGLSIFHPHLPHGVLDTQPHDACLFELLASRSLCDATELIRRCSQVEVWRILRGLEQLGLVEIRARYRHTTTATALRFGT